MERRSLPSCDGQEASADVDTISPASSDRILTMTSCPAFVWREAHTRRGQPSSHASTSMLDQLTRDPYGFYF
jgi:hypothetical protein